MKVELREQGGFAGLARAAAVDTGALSPEERAHVEALVARAGFWSLPPRILPETAARDVPSCRLTVEEGARCHTVVVSELAAADALRELLDWMRERATVAPLRPSGKDRR
jgi:hypothetical protein